MTMYTERQQRMLIHALRNQQTVALSFSDQGAMREALDLASDGLFVEGRQRGFFDLTPAGQATAEKFAEEYRYDPDAHKWWEAGG